MKQQKGKKKKYERISLDDRIRIRELLSLEWSYPSIAEDLGRNKSSIHREVKPWGKQDYEPLRSEWYTQMLQRSRRKGKRKLLNEKLCNYVEEKLLRRWSPEQISHHLKRKFPNDKTMQVSHETIYLYVFLHTKGGLKKELTFCLRQQKKKRKRNSAKEKRSGKIPGAVSIDERPAEVKGRKIHGHWEGDLIVGKGHQSALGTIVERTTRAIILVPLTGTDATTVRHAFEKEFATLPEQMKKTMTYDNGKEMSEHQLFTEHTRVRIYFAHPYSPWERPTNENSNGLIRQYFPKGTDFSKITPQYIKQVQDELNERPRKVLNWKSPKEVFKECILAAA